MYIYTILKIIKMEGGAAFLTARMPLGAFIKSLLSFIVIGIILGIIFWGVTFVINGIVGDENSGPLIAIIGVAYLLTGMYLPLSHVYERGWEDAKYSGFEY
jgi:hypothetical protein